MSKNKKENQNVYIDYKTGNILVSKKGENDSYTFYATEFDNKIVSDDLDISNLKPIDDVIDYIEKNDLDIKGFSKKIYTAGEKKNGK